jgi:hypothetical protein
MRLNTWLHKVLQRRGIGLGSTCLLTVRGRASGELHSIPVLPVEDDGGRWLVAATSESDWVRNARAERWAILAQGRRAEIVQLVELDPERSTPIVGAFAARLRRQRLAFARGFRSLGQSFNDELAAHPVFEVIAGPWALGAGQ